MFNRINKFKSGNRLLIFLLVIVLLFLTNKVYSASLSLVPSPAIVSVGNIVSLKVITSTDNKIINNAEANIQFPVDMLEVVSVSKNSSIFTLWVEEISFSNSTGKINFNGGLPNPGYTGQNGQIATITFKAKKPGVASVIFLDGAVRQNDGLGTDILVGKNSATIQIGIQKEIEIPIAPTLNANVPLKPIILSETHPNQDFWYSNNTATFNWKVPEGVTSLKTLFNKVSDSAPTINYDNSVTQKTLNNISDGVSYFHLRYFNLNGGSLISHYKIKIDSTPPFEFTPTVRKDGSKNIVKLNTEDATSGMDYYELSIDGSSVIKIKKDDLINNEYILPVQNEGEHTIRIKAYDKAGNYRESNTTFISSPISVPLLSLASEEIIAGGSVVVNGKTDYPNEKVNVILEFEGNEIKRYTQNISNDGTFSVTTDKIKNVGVISIWAETVFSEFTKSSSSQKVYLKVNET